MPSLEENFWSRVKKTAPDECWEWIGHIAKNGYGKLSSAYPFGRTTLAHRLSKEIELGSIVPEDKVVMHRCDNHRCVNPAHLIVATHLDNMADMAGKGRTNSGSRILDEEKIIAIRNDNRQYSAISQEYGVTVPTISAIKTGKLWPNAGGVVKVPELRGPKGDKVHGAKLNEGIVSMIRVDVRPHSKIAQQYGVSRQTIGDIKRNRSWAAAVGKEK